MGQQAISFLGIFVIIGIAYLLSNNKKKINWKMVGICLLLQIVFAGLVLGTHWGKASFLWINGAVQTILGYSTKGAEFVFGSLVKDTKSFGFIFAFNVLPTIIFISALMQILYYYGIMQFIISALAKVVMKVMGTSGAETLCACANIFMGHTESPLMIKPYIEKLTKSELFAVMTGGLATISAGVLGSYAGMLATGCPSAAGHIVTACLMSAPASLMIAKIMIPETETPETAGDIDKTGDEKIEEEKEEKEKLKDKKIKNKDKKGDKINKIIKESIKEAKKTDSSPIGYWFSFYRKVKSERTDSTPIGAAASGAAVGLQLALNVGGMLIAFIALIALFDGFLGVLGGFFGRPDFNLQMIFGVVFSPLSFILGIPWAECQQSGNILAQHIVLNEFVAYSELGKIVEVLSPRTAIILIYAICGFANISSIAMQIGGIGSLAPSRKQDIAQLGFWALIAGALTSYLTAAIAGVITPM